MLLLAKTVEEEQQWPKYFIQGILILSDFQIRGLHTKIKKTKTPVRIFRMSVGIHM